MTFSVTQGGGSLSVTRATTNLLGFAFTQLTLGSSAGTNKVEASIANGAKVTFTATAEPLPPVNSLTKVSGDNQTAMVNQTLANAFEVSAVDEDNDAIEGVQIKFEITTKPEGASGASLDNTAVKTNSNGRSSATLTLGNIAGSYVVTASVDTFSVTFTATATNPPPPPVTTFSSVSGNNQTGEVNQTLANAFEVSVADEDSNPIEGVQIDFEITTKPEGASGASLDNTTVNTDSEGKAEATLTLGNTAGSYVVTASIDGFSDTVTFTATATDSTPPPPPPTDPDRITIVSGNNQTAETGNWLSNSFVVKVVDEDNAALSGITVSFSVTPSGTLSRSTHITQSNGQANTRLQLGNTAGTYTVTARVSSVTPALTATFTATATATTTTITTTTPPPSIVVETDTERPVAKDRIIFNEIYNSNDDKQDWIEIKNISSRDVLLNSWEISIVQPAGTDSNEDVDIVSFARLDHKLQPGEVLLLTNSSPAQTNLIRGQDIRDPNRNMDIPPQYLVARDLTIPNGQFLLILRSQSDINGTSDAIEDVAGNYYRQVRDYEDGNTDIWPLRNTTHPGLTTDFLTVGNAWQRLDLIRDGFDPNAWTESGYKAGLGYKPKALTSESLGTPGFPSDSFLNETGDIVISEIMYASTHHEIHDEPQWIELYNNSDTKVVNLEGWKLQIEAPENETSHNLSIFTFKALDILPNQTALLVTHKGRHSDNINEKQVYDLSEHHNDQLLLTEYPRRVIGITGFSLKLFSPDGVAVEQIGNLDGQSGSAEPFFLLTDLQNTGKTLPGKTGRIGESDRQRVSIIRRFNDDGTPKPGDAGTHWKRSANIHFATQSYYGKETDIGSPGYRKGTPLPVTLSHFSAEMQDTGVVINWTTESELNNAGFNILRSENKQGPFATVNPSIIQGAGTTGERNEYTWTDTTAKPAVEYYYQIEDVSFAGDTQILTTQLMKGIFSAKNRMTTVWGGLKIQE
ncbi:lamin tail domain-containing protein [Candidatus Poribacteria bacterium]|nr:lamin tail domain-containing protein [Candidatus Poribacteria bacterium]